MSLATLNYVYYVCACIYKISIYTCDYLDFSVTVGKPSLVRTTGSCCFMTWRTWVSSATSRWPRRVSPSGPHWPLAADGISSLRRRRYMSGLRTHVSWGGQGVGAREVGGLWRKIGWGAGVRCAGGWGWGWVGGGVNFGRGLPEKNVGKKGGGDRKEHIWWG